MKRNYGIDLLKMMAMAMVVAHHLLAGDRAEVAAFKCGTDFGCVILGTFHTFCYCAVDCFVLATGFIMCQHDFKYSRIFRLWRSVVGYSCVILAIAALFTPWVTLSKADLAGVVLPVAFDRYWFFTQYVALFFTIPFLNKLLLSLSGREGVRIVITGFCMLSLFPFLAGRDAFFTIWGYSYVWFLYLYVLGGVLRMGGYEKKFTSAFLLFALLIGCIGSEAGRLCGDHLPRMFGCGGRFGELAWSYASPTMLLESVALLLICSRIDIGNERVQAAIGLFAPSTFIVYVIHSNPVFRQIVCWDTSFRWLGKFGPICATFSVAIMAVLMTAAIICLDVLRRIAIERVWKLLR